MVAILVQIILFLLVVVSYFFVIGSILDFPFILLSSLTKIYLTRHPKNVPQAVAWVSRLRNIIGVPVVIGFLSWLWWTGNWDLPLLKLWVSPLILVLVSFVAIANASLVNSQVGIGGSVASFSIVMRWPILILVVIGVWSPDFISLTIFQWGVTVAGVIMVLIIMVMLRPVSSDIESAFHLLNRLTVLEESLDELQHIAFLIGDTENWKSIGEAIEHVVQASNFARQELQQDHLSNAERFVIQAEIEAAYAQSTFRDRVRLSLPDELTGRLKQASIEITELKGEFEKAGLSAQNLSQLFEKCGNLEMALSSLDLSDKDLIEKIQPFENFFREIIETRTALRFRLNVDSAIDSLENELKEKAVQVEVAKNLGIDTTEANKQRQSIAMPLQVLQSNAVSSSADLVQAYQTVQTALAAYKAMTAILDSTLQRDWNIETIGSGQVITYLPKSCSTNHTARGVALVNYEGNNISTVSFELDGTLLELPAERTIIVGPILGESYGLGSFDFAGKKGGNGNLRLRFKNVSEGDNQISCKVTIIPSIDDIAKDALVWGTPLGAIVFLAQWRIGIDMKEAVPLSAAIGGALALGIFIFNYLKSRRIR